MMMVFDNATNNKSNSMTAPPPPLFPLCGGARAHATRRAVVANLRGSTEGVLVTNH